MFKRLLLFLALNFGALAIGGFFTGSGVPSEWYQELNKAPWTPPGWVFGFAWTLIMICFSIFLAMLWPKLNNKSHLIKLFAFQWLLNVSWNPVFFHFHWVLLGLIVISTLTTLIAYFFLFYRPYFKKGVLLLLPYLIWLMVATSLNGFILFNN